VKKILTAAIVGLALMASGAASAKEWKKVRIASEGAYPPWNATDTSGQLVGLEIDLAKELCARMKVECELVAQEWEGIIPALQSGKYDAIIAAMSITDERKQVITFSRPYVFDPTAFATLKSSPLAQNKAGVSVDLDTVGAEEKAAMAALFASLEGKSVGAQTSTTMQTFAEKSLPDSTVRAYDKSDSMGLDLTAGRLDAIVLDRSVIEAMMKEESGKDITIFGPSFIRGMLGEGFGVGLRKEDGDLKALFDKAVADATADGTIAKLTGKWLGYDASVK